MKLFYKPALLIAGIHILLICTGDQGGRRNVIKRIPSGDNITSTRTHTDRSMDPVITVEAMVRDMRNNNQPSDPDEIRRQRNIARASNIEWIKESTKKYSPDSWHLLMQYDSLPVITEARSSDGGVVTTQKSAETFRYLRGRSRIELLASMETNVHEITHAYFDQNAFRFIKDNNISMNWDNAHGYIYISPSEGVYITFPLKKMFPSIELRAVIPQNLRTYRYDTYIDGTTSTQSEGVIGLLNELNAYYNGSGYSYDMLEAYKSASETDASGLFEWVTRTQSTMSAFYEFDYFIKEYLLFMKYKYPANYNALLSYAPFGKAYSKVYLMYRDLIENYQNKIREEMKVLNSSGTAEAKIEKGWLWVRAGNSNVSGGTPIFSEEKTTLLPVIQSRRYREVEEDFGIR